MYGIKQEKKYHLPFVTHSSEPLHLFDYTLLPAVAVLVQQRAKRINAFSVRELGRGSDATIASQ